MAFTEDQERAILEFVTKAQTPAQAPVANAEKTIVQQAKEAIEAEKGKTIVDEAKAAVDAEKAADVAISQVQESIKFNLGVQDFIEKNKNLLPEESPKILAAVATKTFKDDNEKANTTRKNLLDSFLEKQENISILTTSMQARANYFKSLAESDKEKRSVEFWDLAEVGVALKAGARKAEALNRINGVNAGDDSKSVMESKFLAAAKERFKPQTI